MKVLNFVPNNTHPRSGKENHPQVRNAVLATGKAALVAFAAYKLLLAPAAAHADEPAPAPAQAAEADVVDLQSDATRAAGAAAIEAAARPPPPPPAPEPPAQRQEEAPSPRDPLSPRGDRIGTFDVSQFSPQLWGSVQGNLSNTPTYSLSSPSGEDVTQQPQNDSRDLRLYASTWPNWNPNYSLGVNVELLRRQAFTNIGNPDNFESGQYKFGRIQESRWLVAPRFTWQFSDNGFALAEVGYGKRHDRGNLYREVDFDSGQETEYPADMGSTGVLALRVGAMRRGVVAATLGLSTDPYTSFSFDAATRVWDDSRFLWSVIPPDLRISILRSRVLAQANDDPTFISPSAVRNLFRGEVNVWMLSNANGRYAVGPVVGFLGDMADNDPHSDENGSAVYGLSTRLFGGLFVTGGRQGDNWMLRATLYAPWDSGIVNASGSLIERDLSTGVAGF